MSNGRMIFVTGMPATGKTTVGAKLAYMLDCEHIDIDNDIRKLLGRVDPAVDTHSGGNKEIGRLGHQLFFEVAGFWATFRPGERVVFTIPMIMPNRQALLKQFHRLFADQMQIIVLTLKKDTDEEVGRRLAKRKAEGYVGGVDTIEEYRRVQSIATTLELPHTTLDTSPPRTIMGLAHEVCEIVSPSK